MRVVVKALGSKTRYGIRKIFLYPRDSYSIKDAARLLCTPLPDLVNHLGLPNGKDSRLSWAQLVDLAMQRWPMTTIYEHLGADASKALPPLTTPVSVTLALPQYVELILRAEAERRHVEVGVLLTALLTKGSDQVISKLEAEVPGFGAALRYPRASRA